MESDSKFNQDTLDLTNSVVGEDDFDIEFIDYESALKYLNTLINERNLTKAKLLKLIDHDLHNGYKYLDGSRNMNRDFLIKIIIVLKLDLTTANRLLKLFSHSELYVKIKRDYIILSGITNNSSLETINAELKKHKECDLLI